MAWRGRGRGRGRGGQFGGGYNHYLENPFILFPDDVVLPEPWHVSEKDPLINKKLKLQRYYEASPYYIKEQGLTLKNEAMDKENMNKPDDQFKRDSLSDFIKRNTAYLPQELLAGIKLERRTKKNVTWNPESGLNKIDFFEKLEGKYKGKGKNDEEEKKEGGDEGTASEEEHEEESDDGDYNQNFDFDDDEDDLNMDDDDGNDEGIYD